MRSIKCSLGSIKCSLGCILAARKKIMMLHSNIDEAVLGDSVLD
jgi:hypothetical protein